MGIVGKFDNKRLPLNKTSERYADIRGEYAQAVHVWIINSKGELFIKKKKSAEKKVFQNVWSITVGGVDTGETTLQTVFRECNEELGIEIEPNEIEFLMSYKRKNDFLDVCLVRKNFELADVIMQKEEVSEVKLVIFEKFTGMMKNIEVAPNLEIYF